MANNHEQFREFNSCIRLTDARRKSLKRSRKELRRKIREWFSNNKPDEIQPKFAGQGSFMMDTNINPITRKETIDGVEKTFWYYDVDDGIYFIGDESANERWSVQTYHNWVCEAIDGHTGKDPVDKNTCVRVLYADGHNIDLPIYYKQGDVPELAHKAKGWIDSDPRAFSDWFNGKVDAWPQLRRIVRYLKAWCDYREFCRKDKPMPCGFIMTILAAENYSQHDRDDIAFKETLVNIEDRLKRNGFQCLRPTAPAGENLLEKYNHREYFMEELAKIIKNAKEALAEPNKRKSCGKWQDSLGNRFPCSAVPDEEEAKTESAGLASIAVKSTPWVKHG